MVAIKAKVCFLTPITILPCPEVPDQVKRTAFIAAHFFIQPYPYTKIYFYNSGKEAYAKTHPVDLFSFVGSKAPHSIRKLDETSFILTYNRKDSNILIGTGTYKQVKAAWLIKFVAATTLSIEPIVCANDRFAQKDPFPPAYFERLSPVLAGIEHLKKQTHQTSKGHFKQFHAAKKAFCDAFQLSTLSTPPNFNQLISILKDLTIGIENLLSYGFIHGDLKPSNLLIYLEDGAYLAKLCDLNSVKPIGYKLQEQTFDYLSLFHRFEIIQEILKSEPEPMIDRIEAFYLKNIKSLPSILTFEAMLQSLGLVFADIMFRSSRSQGPEKERELFWKTVSELTGFVVTPEISSRTDLNREINTRLIELAKRGERPASPAIDLETVIHRLTLLETPKPALPISLEILEDREEDVVITVKHATESADVLALQPLLEKIHKLFEMSTSGKIYFNDSSAYKKEMNQSVKSPFPHSFRQISPTKSIIILNRKKRSTLERKDGFTKKKYGWEMTAVARNTFILSKAIISTDLFSQIHNPKKWEIERLSGLSCVECIGERFSFKTSGHVFKSLYITSEAPIDAFSFAQKDNETTLPQFLQICTQILIGMAELHESGLVYGNLKPNKILIFTDAATEALSAKISASVSCVPIGSPSYFSTPEFFSPRIKHLLKIKASERILDPTDDEVYQLYTNDPLFFQAIITPEDETATTGMVLSHLAILKEKAFAGATPEQKIRFWDIMRNLTGDYIPRSTFRGQMNFFKEIDFQIKELSRGAPPTLPRISLREAASQMASVCSA